MTVEDNKETESSMRDDFEEAIGEVEGDTTEGTNEPVEEQTPDASEQAPEEETTPETDGGEIRGEEPTAPADSGAEGGTDESSDKAPASWTPAAREEWENTPQAIRDQINKREGQITHALQDGAESRKTGERFNDVVNKFATVIAAEGVQDPIQGFEALMNTMTTMRMGNPQQKAQQIANFIKNYDVDIQTLDSMLAGVAPQARDSMDARLDERMQPVNELMNRINQAQQQNLQQNQQTINNEVDTFGSKAEFYNDVRMDMADLLDMASRNQQPMTLEQAYNKACALNPEISNVIAKRAETSRIMGDNKSIEEKQNAGSSLSGKQSGTGGGSGEISLHDELSQLWDAQAGQQYGIVDP